MYYRSDYDVFVDYVEKNDPIDITVEGRITIVYGGDSGETTTSTSDGESGSGSGSGSSFRFSSLFLIITIFVWRVL